MERDGNGDDNCDDEKVKQNRERTPANRGSSSNVETQVGAASIEDDTTLAELLEIVKAGEKLKLKRQEDPFKCAIADCVRGSLSDDDGNISDDDENISDDDEKGGTESEEVEAVHHVTEADAASGGGMVKVAEKGNGEKKDAGKWVYKFDVMHMKAYREIAGKPKSTQWARDHLPEGKGDAAKMVATWEDGATYKIPGYCCLDFRKKEKGEDVVQVTKKKAAKETENMILEKMHPKKQGEKVVVRRKPQKGRGDIFAVEVKAAEKGSKWEQQCQATVLQAGSDEAAAQMMMEVAQAYLNGQVKDKKGMQALKQKMLKNIAKNEEVEVMVENMDCEEGDEGSGDDSSSDFESDDSAVESDSREIN